MRKIINFAETLKFSLRKNVVPLKIFNFQVILTIKDNAIIKKNMAVYHCQNATQFCLEA